MTIDVYAAFNEARLQGVVDFLLQGSAPAAAWIYAGTRPALGGTPSGELLVTIPFAAPVGTITAGVLVVTETNDAMCIATGTATWARIVNGAASPGFDCSVSDLLGDGDIKLDSVALFLGGQARIISGTWT